MEKITGMTVNQLERIMTSKEGESLEFKEAKNTYDFEKLVKYCAALANEGGGTRQGEGFLLRLSQKPKSINH